MRTVEKTLISSLKKGKQDMDIDFRVAFVLLPVIAAVSWALFNIAPAAIKQIQAFLNREA
jgi:photosystem II PsbY protein